MATYTVLFTPSLRSSSLPFSIKSRMLCSSATYLPSGSGSSGNRTFNVCNRPAASARVLSHGCITGSPNPCHCIPALYSARTRAFVLFAGVFSKGHLHIGAGFRSEGPGRSRPTFKTGEAKTEWFAYFVRMTREKVATVATNAAGARRWGQPPWTIEFRAEERELPEEVDFAVVGGGFTGLAAAAWLRHLEPKKSVAVFEASRVGAGSSGHTGGMALAGAASGDLPGLGDVLGGFSGILRELRVRCRAERLSPGRWSADWRRRRVNAAR